MMNFLVRRITAFNIVPKINHQVLDRLVRNEMKFYMK